ncbi:hypothetical protein [Parasitella parasitica]|uniref:Uncharacterized protein n=1 Tax=Parasitella parasitica TaxID=35722 RepID=A0A0B7NTV8_9FUNG|nr:hypothetical protein [Parasitella parasitica]
MGTYIVVRKTEGESYVLADKPGSLMDKDYAPSELKGISHNILWNDEDVVKVHKIEGILDHRETGSKIDYKTSWKGRYIECL